MFALLGSGEFLPWTSDLDRRLLEGSVRPHGPVLVMATASAPEGDAVFAGWGSKGIAHYRSLGVAAEALELRTRADAARPELADRLAEASAVIFSGGNPVYAAATLADTPFWRALLEEVAGGLPLAGCSAGAAMLGESCPDSRRRSLDPEVWRPGLGLFPRTWLLPHWDAVERFVPGAREAVAAAVPEGRILVTLDERTAVIGDGRSWEVTGEGRVGFDGPNGSGAFAAGERFELPLEG